MNLGTSTNHRYVDKGEFVSCPLLHSQASVCLFQVFFLAVENRFVQHLAGNVLVSVAEFVALSEENWSELIDSLCLCLEQAIYKSLSSTLDPPSEARDSDCSASYSALDLGQILHNASWSLVGGMIHVLQCILKHLKHADDWNLLEIYLNSLGSCLSGIPWDLLNEVPACHTGDVLEIFHGSCSVSPTFGLSNLWFEFCGYLVQCFCSLAAQSSFVEAPGGSLDEHPSVRKIRDIIPKLLSWCLCKNGERSNSQISQYLKHKILVLMIRLISQGKFDCSVLILWLQLIHKYFQDLF